VFEPDDTGRSYRLRPLTRSIWLRRIATENGFPAFFLVPDGPGLADAINGTTAVPLETSRQTTNSWGLRGPEPALDAPLRGLILGDSFMQGMFIGDDETPPECLRRYLQGRLKIRVSILNAGLMGYSPEQYYYSLIAFAERFRPHFVVVSICANDFGDIMDATSRGMADWQEGKYWLKRIMHSCLALPSPCLIVPVPIETNMLKRRNSGYYPGILSNMLEVESLMYLDPMEDFVNAHAQSWVDGQRKGRPPMGSALFNDVIGDGHFSAAGSEVWAESVGRRLLLVLEQERISGEQGASEGGRKPE
jgi:lysophospholipase L1-like esterase